jgi:hypothetical protein
MAMKSTTANKFWTPEDDERLKSLIENSTSLNCVAAKLQRSVSAVKNRAHAQKISIARTVQGEEMMGRRPWTIQDDDQLRVLAATGETSGSIAVRLKRGAGAIRKRATSLGIVLAGSTKALGLEAKGK